MGSSDDESPEEAENSKASLAQHGYSVGKTLGAGSYSTVKCVMKEGVTYACKIVSKELTSSVYQTKFLPRELKILGSTRHPHIARIYTIIEEPRKVFIIMELAGGGDLLEKIQRVRRLDERTTHVYFMQLASALAYLHKNDIAHRDLKCENVLLTTIDVVKLTDFSFSRYCTSAATKKKELSATFCGSEAYAAPEILQGIRYLPKREDMWSLGVILYVMVTGDLPFESGNLPRQLRLQMTRVVRFPKVLPLSNELKNLIRCMLEPVIGLRASMGRVIRHPWIRRYPSPFKELSRKIYQERLRTPSPPAAPVGVPPQDPAVPPPPRVSAGPGESSRGGEAAALSDSASKTASELESLGVRKGGSGAEDQRSGGSSGSRDGSRETSGLRELKRQQAVESLAIGYDAAMSNQNRTGRPTDDHASGKQSREGSTGSDASAAAVDA